MFVYFRGASIGLLLPLLVFASVGAEEADASGPRGAQTSSLKGLSTERIVELFGTPDTKRSSATSDSQAWSYGDSLVFFAGGKVRAWSDAGELRWGKNLAAIQESHGSGTADRTGDLRFKLGWKNAWTPKPRVSRRDILDFLLEEVPVESAGLVE